MKPLSCKVHYSTELSLDKKKYRKDRTMTVNYGKKEDMNKMIFYTE